MDNANSTDYLQKIKIQVIENLRQTVHAPSVQQTEVPRDPEGFNEEADAELDDLDEDENPDARFTKRRWDKYVEKDGELSDSEDEEENEANGVRRQRNGPKRRRNIMDFQNPLAVPEDNLASGAASVRSGRSRANGIEHSELSDDEAGDEDSAQGDGDDDVDMIDNPPSSIARPNGTTREGMATPPDSPTAAVQTLPADVLDGTGNDAMDEGDTLPDDAREAGREMRELADVDAERRKEADERRQD